jgi:hypothetical protein
VPAVTRRLVTGGCDNLARVWRFNDRDDAWESEAVLEGAAVLRSVCVVTADSGGGRAPRLGA